VLHCGKRVKLTDTEGGGGEGVVGKVVKRPYILFKISKKLLDLAQVRVIFGSKKYVFAKKTLSL